MLVLPVHHPAYLFRDPSEILPSIYDWAKVPRMLAGTWPQPVPPPLVGRHVAEILAWFTRANEHPWLALDTEYFPETGQMTMLGLGMPTKDCCIIPWLAEGHHTLLERDRAAIAHALARYPGRLVMHNALADLPILKQNLGVAWDVGRVDDTMLAHACLWSELGHDLGLLTRIYGQHNQHKGLRDEDPIAYNHGDVLATIGAWVALERELANDAGSERVYREQSLPLIPVLLQAHERGIRLDQAAVKAMAEELAQDKARITQQAQATIGWPINLGSVTSAGGRSHLQTWLGQAMGYKGKRQPKTGRPTWDDDALAALAKTHPDDPIIEARLAYAGVTQLLSHYIQPFLTGRGEVVERCYPRFSIHTQTSGRWSTQDPPMATLPRSGRLDALFVPDPGEVWLGYDMDKAELWVMACEAREERMLARLRSADIHTDNAMAVFGWSSLPDDWQGKRDERRTFGKVMTHRLDYCGDPDRCLDIPGAVKLGFTKATLRHAADAYFAQYPGLKRYHARKTEEYLRTKTARTFMGRRRVGFGQGMAMVRELINHPFQGGVADIFNLTTIRIWHALQPLGGRFVYQSHDAAWWGVPRALAAKARAIIEHIFLDTWAINGIEIRMPISWKEMRDGPDL